MVPVVQHGIQHNVVVTKQTEPKHLCKSPPKLYSRRQEYLLLDEIKLREQNIRPSWTHKPNDNMMLSVVEKYWIKMQAQNRNILLPFCGQLQTFLFELDDDGIKVQ